MLSSGGGGIVTLGYPDSAFDPGVFEREALHLGECDDRRIDYKRAHDGDGEFGA